MLTALYITFELKGSELSEPSDIVEIEAFGSTESKYKKKWVTFARESLNSIQLAAQDN